MKLLWVHTLSGHLSLYKSIFVQVTTFNSRAWDNLTNQQINKLQTVQLKFLKRILHAPASTTNCFTFMELGILPIEFNINISQLNYLYTISLHWMKVIQCIKPTTNKNSLNLRRIGTTTLKSYVSSLSFKKVKLK